MKKGFTLIELLAVIVILAIIALIATPIILGIINDSKKESIKSSAKLYVDGLSKKIASMNMIDEFNPSTCTVSNGDVTCDGQSIDYQVDGKKPTSGSITLDNGKITEYTLSFTDYTVTKDSNGIRVTAGGAQAVEFNGTYVAAGSSDTHKGIVYLDPTDLSVTCTAEDAADNVNAYGTPTGIKDGCMKFYIYDDSGSNYKLILDHNTSGDVAWVTESDFLEADGTQSWQYHNNTKGPVTANKQLRLDTAGWVGNPRLITADEIAELTGADSAIGWETTNTENDWFWFDGYGNTYDTWQNDEEPIVTAPNKSKYAWLYDYLYGCIEYFCNFEDNNEYPNVKGSGNYSINGYWTSSASINVSDFAWTVYKYGDLGNSTVTSENYMSIRPVITLSKSIFE